MYILQNKSEHEKFCNMRNLPHNELLKINNAGA